MRNSRVHSSGTTKFVQQKTPIQNINGRKINSSKLTERLLLPKID